MQIERLRSLIRESVKDHIKEIEAVAEAAAMEARLAEYDKAIKTCENKIVSAENLEEIRDLVDEGKINELRKKLKDLKKTKEKLEKQKAKKNKGSKEVTTDAETDKEKNVDETYVEETYTMDEMENDSMKEEALNESFLKMQKLAGIITETQYNQKKKLIENQLNENTKHTELKPLEDILLQNGYKFAGDDIGFSDKATYEKEANKINTYEISLFKNYLDKYPVRILYFVGEDYTFSNGKKMNRGEADISYNSIDDAKQDIEGISKINTAKQI